MVRQSLTAFALFTFGALGLGRDPGCGGVDDQKRGANGPCTRNDDCGGGLLCLEGVCRSPDAGASDAGASDAG